jgi:hypothetical protein
MNRIVEPTDDLSVYATVPTYLNVCLSNEQLEKLAGLVAKALGKALEGR